MNGTVAGGVNSHGRMIIIGALVVVAMALTLSGSPVLGAVFIPASFWIYVPLKGDYHNSAVLIGEIQKALKARSTPPKPARTQSSRKSTPRSAASAPGTPVLLAESDDETEEDEE